MNTALYLQKYLHFSTIPLPQGRHYTKTQVLSAFWRRFRVNTITKNKFPIPFKKNCFVWSWRESNPRPNKEKISFLHVYLRLNFRVPARPKPPTDTLSFLFHYAPKAERNYLRFIRTSWSSASKRRPLGSVSFWYLVPELSLIYFIRLSSKSVVFFASYNFKNLDLRAVFSKLDMLTYQFCLLSKPNSPFVFEIYNRCWYFSLQR